MTLLELFGSRVEAILFCPDHVAWLSVSLDPLSQSHRGPEETQKTPERSGDTQKGLLGTLPERQQHSPESLSSVPGLSGSVPLLSMSFSSCSYYKETWSPNMDRHQLCVFWQDTSSLGLMFPIYKTKDLD